MLQQALRKLRPSSSERPRVIALLIVAAFATLFAACGAQQDNPIPPAPKSWVTDDAGILVKEAVAALNARLEAYERQTGHEVMLWVGTQSSLPLEELATRTFQAWKIGKKGRDDGVLILVLATDHKIAIEVGYGLEDRVPDAVASRIINDVIVPQMQAGNTEAALSNGVDAVLAAIEGKAVPPASQATPESHAPQKPAPLGAARIIVFGLLALGFLILLITNPSLALYLLVVMGSGGRGGGSGGFGGGGFSGGGGGRSGGGGARGSW